VKDEVKFKEFMTVLCEIHDKRLTQLLSDLYWKILEPFSDEDCGRAFKELVYECKFFPKPAEFIEILKGKKQDQAMTAWIEVVNAIKRIGPYQSIDFGDPVIHGVIEFMGGWPAIGYWLEDDLKWKQREFERLYGIMQGRECKTKYLPGICEIANDLKGFHGRDEIVCLGHDERKQIAIGVGS